MSGIWIGAGGLVLGPSNDLVQQIEQCIGKANDFYQIVFEPPVAAHSDEYHELKVVADRPGVTVRTRTGYYAEPPDASAAGVQVPLH